jgi:hypothetical protein
MLLLLVLLPSIPVAMVRASACEYWVAPAPVGSDAAPGTASEPWATLGHAAAAVPDAGCTVWFLDGSYQGGSVVARRFSTPTVFRAANPYRAVLTNSDTVVHVNGASNVVVEGFELRHVGPGAVGFLVYVDSHDGIPSEAIVLRDNVLHDSYGNDLLKLNEASRFVTIEGNVFSNQGPNEQHIDVNSVTDVVIQDNIFFNDFARSGRTGGPDTKHFIVIKDSNESLDGIVGSERITVRRNVFLNWEGGRETFVKVGNDGKSYHEARDVRVENNLMIGNAPNEVDAVFGIDGARDVLFAHNTVVGDLPANSYAFRIGIKRLNPPNENVRFVNNIWSDPTGTMGAGASSSSNEFSDGDPAATRELTLDNNLYWNGGAAIPPGDLISPLEADARRTVADPGLAVDQGSLVVPSWTGAAFLSGSGSIREEFVRLVESYGRIPADSAAIGKADPSFAPAEDILGLGRDVSPDLGAYESSAVSPPPPPPPPTPPADPTGLVVVDPATGGRLDLSWVPNGEGDLAGYHVYRSTDPAAPIPWTRIDASLVATTTYSDTGLTDGTIYWYYVTAVDAASEESGPSTMASGTPTATPVTRTYVPSSVTVTKGTSLGDAVVNLGADDATYYRVGSVKQGKKHVVDWYGSAMVATGARGLVIVYDGSNSSSATQTLYLFRYTTGAWVQIDARSVGSSDVTVTWSTTSPSTFISPTGEVRVRVSGTRSSSYAGQGDLMQLTLEF